jgi:hypothetical protein
MIRRPTWILLALFVISLGGFWFWQRSDGNETAETGTPFPTSLPLLLNVDANQIQDIKIEDAAGKRLVLSSLGGSSWIITEPERDNVDMDAFSSILQQLTFFQPLGMVDPIPPPDQIGMVIPAYTITVTGQDGKDTVFEVGDQTPTQSGYYVQVEGKLYVVGAATIDAFLDMLTHPPVPAKTATPTGISVSGTVTTTLTTPSRETATASP